jgi:spore maturation protein B
MLSKWMMVASNWVVPLFIFIILAHAFYKKVNVFEAFVEGAREGCSMAGKIIPYMVGLFAAINIFRDSGAMQLLTTFLNPLLKIFRVPHEVIPLMVVRPLSGVAAMTLAVDIFEKFGPDSFVGRLAAVLEGSTDTTFYIIAVYFASVGVKKARYSVAVGLMADIIGFAAAIYITLKFFGV